MKINFKLINSTFLISAILLCLMNNNICAQDQQYIDSILNLIEFKDELEKFDNIDRFDEIDEIDSYRRLFVAYINHDLTKAKMYLDSAMIMSKRIDHKFLIAQTSQEYGTYLLQIAQYKESLNQFELPVKVFRELGEMNRLSVTLNNKALVLVHLGRFNEAIETHIEALKIKEELKITNPRDYGEDYWDESIAASYWNIANIHGDIENYPKSNEYYNKALDIYERLKLIDDVESVKYNIAINLKLSGEVNEAISIFKKRIEYLKSNNYNQDLAGLYDNLGASYIEVDSLAKAKTYIQKSLALKDMHKDTALVGLNVRHLGDIAMQEQNYSKALNYFKQSLEISEKTGTEKVKITDYLRISEANAALGNYKQAYQNASLHNDLYKKILGKENIEKINELEILYDTERKEKDLIIEKDKVLFLEKEAKISALQRWLLAFGLILSLAGLGFVFYYSRQKAKIAQQEKEKLDTELAFKKKELTTHALHLAKKNELLEGLKQKAMELKSSTEEKNGYQKLIRTINFDLQDDNNWENFANYFQQVHKDFNQNVTQKYPDVTPNELRLISLVKMNLSIKEMANILNISVPGVKKARQRLRKKMNLSTKDSLELAVLGIS